MTAMPCAEWSMPAACTVSQESGFRMMAWGDTFFGVPLELILLRVPLRCVHGDELAFDGTHKCFARPARIQYGPKS
jgi:hypothetical protein